MEAMLPSTTHAAATKSKSFNCRKCGVIIALSLFAIIVCIYRYTYIFHYTHTYTPIRYTSLTYLSFWVDCRSVHKEDRVDEQRREGQSKSFRSKSQDGCLVCCSVHDLFFRKSWPICRHERHGRGERQRRQHCLGKCRDMLILVAGFGGTRLSHHCSSSQSAQHYTDTHVLL